MDEAGRARRAVNGFTYVYIHGQQGMKAEVKKRVVLGSVSSVPNALLLYIVMKCTRHR
jgi:hypothetical protein